jgi:hypothetical protein
VRINQVKIHPEDAMVVYRTPAIRRDEDEYSVEQLQEMSDEELDKIFYVILGGA